MTVRNDGEYALTGVGVLDLAGESGSFGSRLLADLGARVIKVEEPGGDPSRTAGPSPTGNDPGQGSRLSFRFENANKLGVTLNLRTGEGRRIFLELVKRNDIVIEGFPPGGMDALGLARHVFELTPVDGGTRVSKSMELIKPSLLARLMTLKIKGEQPRAMAQDLERIKQKLGSS